uniref:Transposase n=1 Tax=Steinernema glaseri TaxID=37863 RepID=A0A1I8A5L5_9BILA
MITVTSLYYVIRGVTRQEYTAELYPEEPRIFKRIVDTELQSCIERAVLRKLKAKNGTRSNLISKAERKDRVSIDFA